MRVALLPIRLDSNDRAANLQKLNRAIDQAAGAIPPPDLLVLPGACDIGHAAPRGGWNTAMLYGVSENIALKAREWGLFVAVGLHVRQGDLLKPYAVLYDSNGDAVAGSPSNRDGVESVGCEPVETWSCAGTQVGVVEPMSVGSPAPGNAEAAVGTVLAMPVASSTAQGSGMVFSQRLRSVAGVHWVVVVPATRRVAPKEDKILTSFVQGPDGTLLLSAGEGEETILYTDLPAKAKEPASRGAFGPCDGHAD